ncbi:uncharacterized protein LOC110449609 [Mizuhopecten yessoensis]|uniref:DED domain-containing protein n=1 Tax=Mizuhopecten yessoensis TaxID=6573 RepID=A0A210QQU4_MIZYE|nr:uncharacterized protein LOC110449609 [Mizuhopecten yessoensis]OWF51105.1 hypothetical protein KP79_PYT16630 [Mizuhopecten yessoensis]
MSLTTMETMETSDAHDDDNNMDEDNLITPLWRFNIFLDKIGQDLSEEEITRMKSFCREGALGRSALNKAKTATSFFQLLRDMEFLNSNNLLQLQAMLWHIGRKDLHQSMVAFAQKCRKEPLYFFTPKEIPANGFRHVKFHVGGSYVNRQVMENLRGYVASLMCVKHTDVFLVGHSPSNSSVLTFMVPETAVDVFHSLTSEDKEIFTSMKVDCIILDDDEIPIVGGQVQKSTTTPEMKVALILRERNKIKSQLDKVQSCLVERTEELREAKRKEECMRTCKDQAIVACLTLLYNHRPVTRLIDSLVSKSAMVYFKHCLQQFQAKFPEEMDTIEILLEAKELVACKTEREIWQKREQNLQLVIALEKNMHEMQETVMTANMQGMHHNSRLLLGGAVVQRMTGFIEVGVNVQTHLIVMKAMEDLSKMISKKQRNIILQHFRIKDSEKQFFLTPLESFFFKLFEMQPRRDTPLDFVRETIRLLNNKKLEIKVLDIIRRVQKAGYQHQLAVQQELTITPQVRFHEGLQRRHVEPDALRRLHNNPEKPKECLSVLQDLANVVQL